MQRRFRLWNVPVQPMVQLGVERGRDFAFTSFTHSEQFDTALKFSTSHRRLLQPFKNRQQLTQFVLGQFPVKKSLLATFVLDRRLAAFAMFFSASIYLDSPLAP